MERRWINGIELAHEVTRSGPPVLCIHGALVSDAMRPLAHHEALDAYQTIQYHRRGFGGSSRPAGDTASMDEQVDDAVGLLDHLGVDAAHVVGHSLGAAIALDLIARHPARVASLVLLEPPLFAVPSGAMVGDLLGPVVERYARGDPEGAVAAFFSRIGGDDALAVVEAAVPGGAADAVKGAQHLFERELPLVQAWSSAVEQPAPATCPVLSVVGTADTPMLPIFLEGRALLHEWFPDCRDADIPGASHLLQMEAPDAVAQAVRAFLSALQP